ncbi:hypothetical protein ACUXST_001725 [Sphingomonas sp. F9_3S_D5_B_2]
MKKALIVSLVAFTFSTSAYAMPPQVSVNWLDNMMQRLAVMAGNPGFCHSANGDVWICHS